MSSGDYTDPLIHCESSHSHYNEVPNEETISTEPEYQMVIHGYISSRWRRLTVQIFSTLLLGIPFLVFHWYPTLFLYATCIRCQFHLADVVLIIETYQKKCKSHYIHKIRLKDISETSGLTNEAYQETEERKVPITEELNTPLYFDDGTKMSVDSYRYFKHKKCVYVWEDRGGRWTRLAGIENGSTCVQLHAFGAKIQTPLRRSRMLNIYGLNEITVQVQSIFMLIILEIFNPFYVFQFFTIAVWLAEPYYYYCIAVVIMTTFGVATSVIQTKKNQISLRNTVESHSLVMVAVGSEAVEIDSRNVGPGDILLLPAEGCRLPCDAVLLNGQAIVNESMLTGESVPVTKTALPMTSSLYNTKEHSSHTLYCGTQVIQTKFFNGEPVRALVLRTGYNTSKGELVRSILYPIPADFKFDSDSYKFIFILSVIATIGLAYTIALKSTRDVSIRFIILKALDIFTIVIPPALPACMTVGRLYAVSRLKRARISCLNTRAVNVSGSLDCMCFDKTGTLTEDGLDMHGVVPLVPGVATLGRRGAPALLADTHPLKLGLAVCHTLTRLGGRLTGDPLEVKMFESTGWILEEPDVPETSNFGVLTPTVVKPKRPTNIDVDNYHVPLELGIVHQNQFVSSLQRSSVVTKVLGEDVFRLFCKGAPETISALCLADTVPENLTEVLNSYAEKGYRLIAMATRVLEYKYTQLQKMTRDEMEHDLSFLGLVIMENQLKGATSGIIRELKSADVHVVMITGDNIHTAVCVAKECGILNSEERVVRMYTKEEDTHTVVYCESTLHGIPIGKHTRLPRTPVDSRLQKEGSSSSSFPGVEAGQNEPGYKIVMNGDTWKCLRMNYPEMIGRVIERGAVFARMTSDQKQQLIVEYQALGYCVGMCGDGANDCGALRAAHTGISLSELESSVAAAYTARDPDIVCVVRVLREGRAALTTSFGVFKFMISYSLAEFLSVAFLYYFDSNLTDFEFLFIDIALILNFAFFFGRTEAYTGKLCKLPPLTSLLGFIPLFSLVGQMIFIGIAQYLSYYAITQFPWYVRHTFEGEEANKCWENYAVFAISMFQYIVLAIVFSHGAPYRRSVITNKLFMASIAIMIAICIYVVIKPAKWLEDFLELQMPLDSTMSYIVLAIAAGYFLVALLFERFIIQFMMEERRIIPRCLKEKRVQKTPHLMIKRELNDNDYLNYDDVINYERENNFARTNVSGKQR